MMVGLIWHNEPGWDKDKAEEAIWTDLGSPLYEGMMDKPSGLVFHTVFLGPSMEEGPVIHMWGEEGDDDNLHCEWADKVVWVTAQDDGGDQAEVAE